MKNHLSALAMAAVLLYALSGAAAMTTSETPDSSDAMKQAEALVNDGKYNSATEKLMEVLKADPQNADAWNLLGFSSRMMGKFDEAEKQYTNALKISPDHTGALNYMGQMFVQTGRMENARDMLARLASACGTCKEFTQLETAIREGKAGNY